MTAPLFLAYLALVAGALVFGVAHYRGGRTAAAVATAVTAWLVYVGVLGASGFVADATRRPPGAAFILVPAILFVAVFCVRSSAAGRFAAAVPLWLLTGAEVFRVGVELFLHQLWREGLGPRLLTYDGGNIDILIGLSAPFVAWALARGRLGRRAILAWNVVGLVALANIVARALLTTPGPFNLVHAEVANHVTGTFPFNYVAGFFAPLAVVLHVLAIRACRHLERDVAPAISPAI